MKLLRRLKRALFGRSQRRGVSGAPSPERAEAAARKAAAAQRREAALEVAKAREQRKEQRKIAATVRKAEAAQRREAARQAIEGGPDFICIGMQKAGTVWLFEQMGNHPGIWQPPVKELHVLNGNPTQRTLQDFMRRYEEGEDRINRHLVERGRRTITSADLQFVQQLAQLTSREPDLAAYARLFALKGCLKSGDVTPAYSTLGSRLVTRLANAFPDVRIILIVREPVDRAWSNFAMTMRRLGEHEPNVVFDDWDKVAEVVTRRANALRSSPTTIYKRWKARFGDRLGVFFFDDLRDDALALRRNIGSFIGVDPDLFGDVPADNNRKATRGKVIMSDRVRERLVVHFANEIRDSAELLGGRATEWPGRYGL